MASQFLFNDQVAEVVPFNAKFHFPDQATRTLRASVKIPPKNGKSVYNPGDTIRFEFPASGYMNPISTLLSMKAFINAKIACTAATNAANNPSFNGRIQQNINSIFSRLRVTYGNQTWEDIQLYGLLNRVMTDAGVSKDYATSLGLMSNIGNVYERIAAMSSAGGQGTIATNSIESKYGQFHARGVSATTGVLAGVASTPVDAASFNPALHGKRFVTPLLSGLFQQRKLWPLKWMSSQFAIELTIDPNPANFLIFDGPTTTNQTVTDGNVLASSTTGMTVANSAYQIFGLADLSMICDLYDFDRSYDAAFRDGLQENGIPIQFNTWRATTYSMAGTVTNAQVHERARSVKLALACVTSTQVNYTSDSGCTFSCVNPAVHGGALNSSTGTTGTVSSYPKITGSGGPSSSGISSYQWRVGGRYFPAQPVEVHSMGVVNNTPEGQEALFELQKALDIVGAYQTGSLFSSQSWCNLYQQQMSFNETEATNAGLARNIFSGNRDLVDPYRAGFFQVGSGNVDASTASAASVYHQNNVYDRLDASQAGGSFFCIAMDFETSNGLEISGINAEEQSDLQLQIKNDGSPNNVQLNVFINVDGIIIIKEANVADILI